LYTVFIQLWPHIYRSQYVKHVRINILHQRLNDNNLDTTPIVSSTENIQAQTVNESNEGIIRTNANNKTSTVRVLPKRLRALDTFRGFSLMVMIFVNYGGMCLIVCAAILVTKDIILT
jgi:hypothetical protein